MLLVGSRIKSGSEFQSIRPATETYLPNLAIAILIEGPRKKIQLPELAFFEKPGFFRTLTDKVDGRRRKK